MLICACGDDDPQQQTATLEFAATVGGEAPSCATMYDGLGTTAASAQLADARFFVSNLELRDAQGDWVAMSLSANPWQNEGVALLDFEDGTGACADSGTSETNAFVIGTVPEGTYDGVRFRVGVPFELNHNDNATAPAPFNVPGMFWNWRGGYKFVRVDWMVQGGEVPRWNVHIGSTGCDSPADTTPPDSECGRRNAATVELTGFDVTQQAVGIELAELIGGADITVDAVAPPPGCMSAPTDTAACTPVFTSLGLSFDSGVCMNDCAGQTVFR